MRNLKHVNTLVKFKGLGIISFNQDQDQGEIAAIRESNHRLIIKVHTEPYLNGEIVNYNKTVTYGPLGVCGLPISENETKIEIKASKNPLISGYELYQSDDDFDRVVLSQDKVISDQVAKSEKNDFRWIVDMDNMHGENLFLSKAQSDCKITNICIKNGLFYASNVDQRFFFTKAEENENTPEAFGFATETIGVEIEAEEVIFMKTEEGTEVTQVIRNSGVYPNLIEIENTSNFGGSTLSDMNEYYKCFEIENGNRFDLSPNVPTQKRVENWIGNNFDSAPLNSDNNVVFVQRAPSVNAPIQPQLDRMVAMSTGFCHPVKAGGGG